MPERLAAVSRRLVPAVRRWGAFFGAAVVVRLLYWRFVLPGWRPDADADQYVLISRSLAAGDGFGLVFPQMAHHPTAFRPPLYPFLLTPGSWLFDDALWPARLLNVVLGSLVVVLGGMLAARIGGRMAGWAAAAVLAVYPPLLANDTVTLTEPLALVLLAAALLLLDERRWVWAGLVTGLVLLTRPNGYLVVAILALWCWRRVDLRAAVGLTVIAGAVLAPWLVRNQLQVGTWRPTTSDGFTIAAIYAEPAQEAGTFIDPVFSPAYDGWEFRLAQFDEAEWNELLTETGMEAALDNPGYVWRTVRRNFRGYFELDPELNRYPERNDGRRWGVRQAALPAFYAVSILGLVGLAIRWRDERTVVLALLTAQFAVLSLVLVAPPRLRAPFDFAACIGVGLLAGALWDRWRRRQRERGPEAGRLTVPEPAQG